MSKKNDDDEHMTLEKYGVERDGDKQGFEGDQRTDVNVNNESDENDGDEHRVFAEEEAAEVTTETTNGEGENNAHSAASDLHSINYFTEVLKSSSDTSISKQKEASRKKQSKMQFMSFKH